MTVHLKNNVFEGLKHFEIKCITMTQRPKHFEIKCITITQRPTGKEWKCLTLRFLYVKQYDSTVSYMEQQVLEPWTHNKAIQKAIESRRIGDETKRYLRTLKIGKDTNSL